MVAILDWLVVVLPTVGGIVMVVFPVRKPTIAYRVIVLATCAILSALIWWQQSVARQQQSGEFEKLPAKIADEVVKILPKGSGGQSSSTWGLTNQQLALLSQRMKPYASSSER